MSRDHGDPARDDLVGFDPVSGTYHVQHEWDGRPSLAYTVLRAVAAITGEEPRELDRLSDVVDPDALERVFAPAPGCDGRASGRLGFQFNGCLVQLYADGHLVIQPSGDPEPLTPGPRSRRRCNGSR